jgi:hypothetical protein
MKRFLKKLLLVVSAAIMSTMLVMCGPTGMDMVGDAMVDAGNMLRDGSDGTMPDAMAQDSCATNCTGGGVLRMMTADTDPGQLVTGLVVNDNRMNDSQAFEIIEGPLVLTDLGIAREDVPHVNVFMTSMASCPTTTEYPPEAEGLTYIALDGQSSGSSVNTRYAHDIHGGRYLVPAGSRLCGRSAGIAVFYVRYAGFRPYD